MTFELPTQMRERLSEDMLIRGYSSKTQSDYLRWAAEFTKFFGGPPDFAEAEDLRRYQLKLANGGASPSKMNACVSALRFFVKVTLGRAGIAERMARVRQEDRLTPTVLKPNSSTAMHSIRGEQSGCTSAPLRYGS